MAELNLTANGTEQERILAYLQLCNRILVSSFGNSPVNIVCVIRASKEVKNRGAFHATIINYVMVIAFIFKDGYFVHFPVKGVDMRLCFDIHLSFSLLSDFDYAVSRFFVTVVFQISCKSVIVKVGNKIAEHTL